MPSLQHIGLTVSDLERSLSFWKDALGMDIIYQQELAASYLERIVREPGAHVRMVQLAFGPTGPRIELFQYLVPKRQPHEMRPADPGFRHICIVCNDLDQRLVRLRAAGGTSFNEPVEIEAGANRGARCVYVRDPDGHVLELLEPPSA